MKYEISCAGFSAHLEAFARERDPDTGGDRLWIVSLVGGVTTVRAVWANLLQGELATIRRGDEPLGWNHRLAGDGVAWNTYQVALPSAGAVHLLGLPDVATCQGDAPDFLLLVRDTDDLPRLFFSYVQRRLRLPLHETWAEWTWGQANDAGGVCELESFGCRALRCRIDEDLLASMLSGALAAGELTIPATSTYDPAQLVRAA
jgi:hypothetical protein